jgi:hypothetical protein
VSLDSSGSFDPWGRPISLTWTLEDPTLGAISDSTFTANNQAGITNAVLTVDNGFGGISTDTAMLIIYDPEGGFVTGGGWFDSPGGAYVPDPTLTGKAVFGFVSKYKKGASIPTGNTEFVFQAADLNFHGTAYDWLVVNQGGSNAQFKGSGKINGSGDYRFMLWAGDKETDTFRIRIWEEIGGVETDIYDNDIDQDIGGGSIVIHVKN